MTRATVVATVLLAAALTAWAPGVSLSSGPLSPPHQRVQCLACHAPLAGVPEARCTDCHRPGTIGAEDGGARASGVSREAVQRLHQSAVGRCVGCHPAHGARKGAGFTHAALSPDALRACEACHARPETGVHVNDIACARCHLPEGWRPAFFRHQKGIDPPCMSCHETRRPTDAMHADGADCGACHGTGDWRGASVDHTRFFPLEGEHRVSCLRCHVEPGNFKRYVCTTCHEHSPQRLAHEHSEEGITDLSDCVRCHRGGEGHGSHGR